MKAVVLEVKEGSAAVLAEDGRFLKIKDRGYQAGMELTLNEKPEKSGLKQRTAQHRRVYAWALSAAAVLLLAIGVKDFYTPYSTISIDVNPSLEVSANRYDLVLKIEAANDDAALLVSELNAESLRYKSVETVVEAALTQLSAGDYQAENGLTYVMMAANSKNTDHSEELAEQMETIGEEHTDLSVTSIAADDELVARAKDAGTTAGKLYLVERLKDAEGPEEIDESAWLNKPVKDIVQEIDRAESAPEQVPPDGSAPVVGNGSAPHAAETPAEVPDSMQTMPQNLPEENHGDRPENEPAPAAESGEPGNTHPDEPEGSTGSENPGGSKPDSPRGD